MEFRIPAKLSATADAEEDEDTLKALATPEPQEENV